MSESRNDILDKIRNITEKRKTNIIPEPDLVSPVYFKNEKSLTEKFKEEIEAVNGNFVECQNTEDLTEKIAEFLKSKNLKIVFCYDNTLNEILTSLQLINYENKEWFSSMEAAITSCEFLIARTGSVMVSSALSSGRKLNVFPPVHLVVAEKKQLVYDLADAYKMLLSKYKELPSSISLITGPSRTADIEKTLILGAHGPKELYVFLVN